MSIRKSTDNYIMVEYVWISADQSIRSKSRTVYINGNKVLNIPDWNYDGSSTGQAPGDSSEIILQPIALYKDPFREGDHKIVLCNCIKADGSPVSGYNRDKALEIFREREHEDIWFGLEQEYVLFNKDGKTPLGWCVNEEPDEQGPYYCGVGTGKVKGREIVEEHYKKCLDAGLRISGVNAEVMLGQWEYQVGPCEGITSGDELWMSRYIMERVCEKHKVIVSYDPKPIEGDWNGSGCHANFSTRMMRENGTKELYMDIIKKLEVKHKEHIKLYGEGNERRLTGDCETASIDDFSYGVGDRGASIRIPSDVSKNNYQSGYLEDRRPASNMDPYLVTSKIAETIC
jgi:glutamine synthetase